MREVWAYTDAYGFADLMEHLASYEKPWLGAKSWESIEGEFKFSATCSKLGQVTFELELSHYGCAEEWLLKIQINSELGQLPKSAKSARRFFGKSPSYRDRDPRRAPLPHHRTYGSVSGGSAGQNRQR